MKNLGREMAVAARQGVDRCPRSRRAFTFFPERTRILESALREGIWAVRRRRGCYAPCVDREILVLPEGWEASIPEAIWPEAMLSAVRRDLGALSTQRVIDTLRSWQSQAYASVDAAARLQAQERLQAVGIALLGDPDSTGPVPIEDSPTILPGDLELRLQPEEDRTVDGMRLPPKPHLRREVGRPVVSEMPPNSAAPRARRVSLGNPESDTESKVRARGVRTGASAPPESAFDEENPTTAFFIPESKAAPPPPPPPPLREPRGPAPARGPTPIVQVRPAVTTGEVFDFEEEDDPTRHIALPEEVLRRRLSSAGAALNDLSEPERTQMATYPPKPPPLPERADTPKVQIVTAPSKSEEPPRLPPKPGVIRRSGPARNAPAATRPRAAMHHVRALHGLLHAFVEELVPLSYERRSRRFWARWREVAGDRGVRRDFIEELLRTATNGRTLLCELIAEMQSADPNSVFQLVDKLAKETPSATAGPSEVVAPALPQLLGESFRPDSDDS
jgi:hypothetical protein